MRDEVIKTAINSVEKITRCVYSHGYEDGKESVQIDDSTAYERGLNDAWECARKMTNLSFEDFNKIFNKNYVVDAIRDYSASEAMAKIKEYEEKQKKNCDTCQYLHGGFNSLKKCANCYGNSGWTPKQTEDEEIKVGDEVISDNDISSSKGVVVGITNHEKVKILWLNLLSCSEWTYAGAKSIRTGRTFPQLVEILKQMKEEE